MPHERGPQPAAPDDSPDRPPLEEEPRREWTPPEVEDLPPFEDMDLNG